MSDKIGLNAYVVKMRKRMTASDLESSLGGPHDATAVFYDYLNQRRTTTTKVQRTSTAFSVIRLEKDETIPSVHGLIEFGEYGRAATLKDVESGSTTHRKGRNESEFSPRYFRAHFPNGRTRGVFLVQQNGSDKTKATIENDLRSYCENCELTLAMNPLTHQEALEKFLGQGQAKTLRVTRYVRNQFSDEILRGMKVDGEQLDQGAEVEIVIRHSNLVKRIGAAALSVSQRATAARDLIEIAGLDGYDDVAVDVQLAGKTRKMSLTSAGGTAMRYDVTNDIELDGDGHPTYSSIDTYAKKLCRDLVDKIV
ncbi:MAG TPA: hypothetical protein VGN72_06665 [Tepidisphaeraceae bacterium]|jgi:hypothetical protein|nr:hypothetical protein [Tepidisphaeraceae bacterium]